MTNDTSRTGSTLFTLLAHPADAAAWSRFVDRYGPEVFRWCRKKGLQPADAEDVTQEVLLGLAKGMRNFRYDPAKAGFRAWLKTVTAHALSDLGRQRHKLRGSGDPAVQGLLDSIAAAGDLDEELKEQFERELFEHAASRVRIRIDPKTWQAFAMLVFEEKSGAEAAAELGMSEAAIYMAKSRVKRMLEDEIKRIEGAS